MATKPIAGLIVVAGLSSRMHSFKPLLELDGKTIIEKSIESLRLSGIKDIYAVCGYRVEDIEPLLRKQGVKMILNQHYAETDMLASVRLGVAALKENCEAFFLLPGDMPLVRPYTLQTLIKLKNTEKIAVIRPAYSGRRGHPPLIDKSCFENILTYEGTDGLRGALACFKKNTVDYEIPDPGILIDADTPDDYARMCQYAKYMGIPSPELCEKILKWFGISEDIAAHCKAVAVKAKKLSYKLIKAGYPINIQLVEAAALLHDIAKGQDNHAQCGRDWLEDMGYGEVARVVGTHTDLPAEAIDEMDERAILYLADKLTMQDKCITLDERFCASLDKYQNDALILKIILERKNKAMRIKNIIDNLG